VFEDGIEEGWLMDAAAYADRSVGAMEQDPIVYGEAPDNRTWNTFCWSNQYTALTAMMTEDEDFEMTTWPSKDSTKSNYLKPSQFFSISATTENPEEAVKFLNFLINDIDCNNILLGERGVPLNSEVAAEVEKQLSEDDQKIYDFVYNVVQPNSSVINPPNPDGASEVTASLKAIMEELCYGQIDASTAAERLLSEASTILSSK
jgi:multiple sugar transport system substrate-binding protein